ncbi:MAG: glycerate kinase [Rhodospirillaceae bacterium]|nr:MAG: glycerate kinase [Rhodospirillaceae bacterium]
MTAASKLLRKLFDVATDAALPKKCLGAYLPPPPKGRTIVIGAGKAAAAMAAAVEDNWPSDSKDKLEGLVVTRYGHSVPTQYIEVLEASHPVPDQAGRDASERILKAVQGLTEDDLVLCLISGGGSALLSLPADGLSMQDKQALTSDLLRSGATITEMNCVRKHLSKIKGGRLAMACHPANVVSLIISDVPGDDLSSIASGVTVVDPSTYADARAVLEKYNIQPAASISKLLQTEPDETPKPGDERFGNVQNILISTPQMALQAAAKVALEAGYTPMILSDRIEGESRDAAQVLGAIARQVAAHGQPLKAPTVLLSGGETTVTISGKGGRGGPNSEFLLALAVYLDGHAGIHAIACDTDGIDGSEDNAGAVIDPESLKRAETLGLDAKAYLANNDAYSFFKGLDDLVMSGPTLTNVNDFRAIIIDD